MVRVRVGSALVTALTLAATTAACTNEPDKVAPPPQAASSSSTAAPQPPTDRAACQAAQPPTWQQAIDGGKIDAGGPTMPLAVSGGGEIVAARDNGDTRDLLLIGADKSVSEIYAVPDPNRNSVGFAAIDDRWIVVGVDRAPRNANGVLPTLTRIDLIDRKGGPVRTVVQSNDEDFSAGGSTIDSVAFYGGKVYWITHEKYASSNGVTRSYDPETEKVAEVAAGALSDLRAGAVGLTGIVDGPPGSTVWQRTEVTMPAELPGPVADAAGTGPDRLSLATDGTSYAWLTGVDRGVTGVAWWSPQFGLVRINGDIVEAKQSLPPFWLAGPYVVIGKGRIGTNALATVVDMRSGATTKLDAWVVAAGGGSMVLAVQSASGGKDAPHYPVAVRADNLPPLTC